MENYHFESDILFQIRHLNKCLKKDFDERLASYGLTGQQGRILFCINGCYEIKKEIHQNDIEECFQLSKSTVSEMVTRMTANGLIEKISAKPYFSLVPTDKGRSIVNEIHASKKEVINKLFAGLSEDDIENITKYIQKMTENIEKEEEKICGKK